MAEKVVAINVGATTNNQPVLELDMKPVNALLDNGYKVKQVTPIPFEVGNVGYTTIVFVLEKRSGNSVSVV